MYIQWFRYSNTAKVVDVSVDAYDKILQLLLLQELITVISKHMQVSLNYGVNKKTPKNDFESAESTHLQLNTAFRHFSGIWLLY